MVHFLLEIIDLFFLRFYENTTLFRSLIFVSEFNLTKNMSSIMHSFVVRENDKATHFLTKTYVNCTTEVIYKFSNLCLERQNLYLKTLIVFRAGIPR
jgi:hypothetical protein